MHLIRLSARVLLVSLALALTIPKQILGQTPPLASIPPTDGSVNAILQNGNTVYIGGDFSYVGPLTGAAANVDATTGAPIAGFPVLGNNNGGVFAAVSDGAGGWFLGGNFELSDTTARLIHVLANQTVDPNWNPNPDGNVFELVRVGTTLYVMGNFESIAGQGRNYLAALSTTTGLATSWNPNPNGEVDRMIVSGSTVYIGGVFTQIGGQPRNFLGAVSASTGVATAWDPNPNNVVGQLLVSDTTVYVTGNFTMIGGQSRNQLAALNITTGAARAWNPSSNVGEGFFSLAVSGSTVYVVGEFTEIGGQMRPHGVAALSATTGLATAWNPTLDGFVYSLTLSGSTVYVTGDLTGRLRAINATTGVLSAWNPDADESVSRIVVSGSTIYAIGEFTQIGGQPRRRIAAIDATTGLATAFSPNPYDRNDEFSVFVIPNGSTVFLRGTFSRVGGQYRNGLAAIDATTGQVTNFNPAAPNGTSDVSALAQSGSTLYVAGNFNQMGGQPANRLAALSTSTGLALSTWAFPGLSGGTIRSMVTNGTTLFIAGDFFQIGTEGRYGLAALNPTTGAPTSWNPATNDDSGNFPYSLALSGSTLYVGGRFSQMGGQMRSRLAAVDITSGMATSWNPSANDEVLAIAVSGSTVYVGGRFSEVGGLTRSRVAALDATTGMATTWNAAAAGNEVRSIAVSAGTVYVGGNFTSMGGQSRNHIAALDPSTALARIWQPVVSDLGSGQGSFVNAIVPSASSVFVGGRFRNVSGSRRDGFAAFTSVATSAETSLEASVFEHYSVGPNPTTGPLTVRLSAKQPFRAQFELVDVLGQRLFTHSQQIQAGDAEAITLNVPVLSQGLYLLRVRNTDSGASVRTDRVLVR